MTALDSHLEQISQSSKSIADIEFPPSKIFTNALLGNYEITTLIRDTEPHERALFSLDPSVSKDLSSRRGTQTSGIFGSEGDYGRKSFYGKSQPLKQSAVAKVLGPDMLREIRQSSTIDQSKANGVQVEVLLRGAEKLSEVYSVAGVQDKITTLRNRYSKISASVSSYEEKVKSQQSQLNQFNHQSDYGERKQGSDYHGNGSKENQKSTFTEQDFQIEEEEIRELEARKRALEDRVAEMGKDLGGLLR